MLCWDVMSCVSVLWYVFRCAGAQRLCAVLSVLVCLRIFCVVLGVLCFSRSFSAVLVYSVLCYVRVFCIVLSGFSGLSLKIVFSVMVL